jgi:secernin
MAPVCDSLVALGPATAGGRTIFAKNSDRPPDEYQVIERHPPSHAPGPVRCTYIEVEAVAETIGVTGSRPSWQWGFEHGINDAGVAAGNETIYTTLDPRGAPAALIGMDLVRLGLTRAITAASCVEVMTELLDRYGQGGSGHRDVDRPYWSSFLVADPDRAFVLETSGAAWEVEEVTRVRAISNRTTIPAFDAAHRHPKQPVERFVDPRWDASKRLLEAEPVSVDGVMAHLRSHVGVEGWTVCMHVEGVEATTASLVAELAHDGVTSHWLLGSPCQEQYVTMRIPAHTERGG